MQSNAKSLFESKRSERALALVAPVSGDLILSYTVQCRKILKFEKNVPYLPDYKSRNEGSTFLVNVCRTVLEVV